MRHLHDIPDETAGPMLEKQLASARYDCVVIGGD